MASSPVTVGQELGLIVVITLWAPCILAVVSAPVRWLDELLRAEGAVRTGVAADPEFTQVARIAIWLASIGWTLGVLAFVAVLVDGDGNSSELTATFVLVAISGAALAFRLVKWTRRRHTSLVRSRSQTN